MKEIREKIIENNMYGINQLGHQWAGGHIGVVADCLSGTLLQNSVKCEFPFKL